MGILPTTHLQGKRSPTERRGYREDDITLSFGCQFLCIPWAAL